MLQVPVYLHITNVFILSGVYLIAGLTVKMRLYWLTIEGHMTSQEQPIYNWTRRKVDTTKLLLESLILTRYCLVLLIIFMNLKLPNKFLLAVILRPNHIWLNSFEIFGEAETYNYRLFWNINEKEVPLGQLYSKNCFFVKQTQEDAFSKCYKLNHFKSRPILVLSTYPHKLYFLSHPQTTTSFNSSLLWVASEPWV